MTHEKARDFFSAYHEGTLEAGLRLSLDQKFSSDAELRSEYDRFTAALDQLSLLRDVPIDIPFDLNDRIGARLDKQLWEQKQSAPKAWFVRFRLAAFSGVAALLLIGAAFSIKNHNADGPMTGGIVDVPQSGGAGEQLSVAVKQSGLTVEFAPQAKKTVVFRMEPDTKPFAQATTDRSAPLRRALTNPNPETDLVSVEVLDAPKVGHAIIAVPGTRSEKAKAGSGTLEEFAKVLAARYRVPVWLNDVKDPLVQVSWDLEATDARHCAEAALKGQYSVDTREGGLVTISRG